MDKSKEGEKFYILTDELPTIRGRYFCIYGSGKYKDGITWDGREADINWAKNLNAKFLKEVSKEELAALIISKK